MAVYRIPVELVNTAFPSTMANVWHARTDTSDVFWDPVTEENTVMGELRTFYTNIAQVLAAGTTVRFPSAIANVETQEEVQLDAIPDVTTTSTTYAPKGLSIVISWRTSSRSRRGRGRTFVGPLADLMLEPGTGAPAFTYKQAIQDAADALVAASSGVNGWAFGVWGQQDAGVAEPKVLRDFTQGVVANEFSLLRSRRD